MKKFRFNDRKITVDEETGAVYIYIIPSSKMEIFKTEQLKVKIKDKYSDKMIMVDLDSGGNLIGIEIL